MGTVLGIFGCCISVQLNREFLGRVYGQTLAFSPEFVAFSCLESSSSYFVHYQALEFPRYSVLHM